MSELPPLADGTPGGWYTDPGDSAQTRWWDGQQWTENRQPREADALTAASASTAGSVNARGAPRGARGLYVVAGVLGASLLLLALGAIGPWITAGPFERVGTSTDDGILMAAAAGAALVALLLFVIWPRRVGGLIGLVLLVLLGLLECFIAIYDLVDITDRVSGAQAGGITAGVGWGIIVATLGAVTLLVAAVVAMVLRRRARA